MRWVIANEEKLTGEALEALARSIFERGLIKTITQCPDLIKDVCNENQEYGVYFIADLLLIYIPSDIEINAHNELKKQVLNGHLLKQSATKKEFKNWAETVVNTPSQTHFPKKISDAMAIVKSASQTGKRVRVSNFRHSWSSVFSDDDEVLISLQSVHAALGKPSISFSMDEENEFQGINLVGHEYLLKNTKHHICKVGSATSNDHLRIWSKELWEQKKEDPSVMAWNIPYNVILVENSMGGVLSNMCHGSGIFHKSLTDLVIGIEYVDARGDLAIIYDPDVFSMANATPDAGVKIPDARLLKIIAGHFGLIGIVTNIYIQLDEMTFARFQPKKTERLALSVPPRKLTDIPPQVDMSGITERDIESAKSEFIANVKDKYYCEWFFFPYQNYTWTNIWQNDGNINQSELYPTKSKVVLEEVSEYTAYLIIPVLQRFLTQKQLAQFFGDLAFKQAFSSEKPIVTPVSEAIHFQRGIHNLPVYDMEVEVPIPVSDEKIEWDVVFQSWWKAINVFYSYTGDKQPIQTSVEMRICGGSDITMAPYKGNFATCSIEILTLQQSVSLEDWTQCMQKFIDELAELTDSSGKLLNIRPHWNKQWDGVYVRGMDIKEYLRDVYKENIDEFKRGLEKIASHSGVTMKDIQKRFGNITFDQIIFD